MRACGPARADRRPMRGAHYLGPPRVFSAGLRTGPVGQTLIAIPNILHKFQKRGVKLHHIFLLSLSLNP